LAHVVAAGFFGVDICHSSKLNHLFTFYLSLFLLKEKVTKKLCADCYCFLKVLMRSLR
jgi:hypothetical protein